VREAKFIESDPVYELDGSGLERDAERYVAINVEFENSHGSAICVAYNTMILLVRCKL